MKKTRLAEPFVAHPGSEPTVTLCPECQSDETELNWFDAADISVGIDTQLGVCRDCDHEWNECARARYE